MGFVDWLESNMMQCFYEKYFGMTCPGCGFQRSLIALLRGDFYESFVQYPALIPILLMVGFLITHLIFKFKQGGVWLKYMFIFNVAIIVVNFIIKQII